MTNVGKKYVGKDDDLPGIFHPKPANRLARAVERIRVEADALGIEVTSQETAKLSIILVGIEEDGLK